MSRTEWALVAAGFVGFGLVGVGHYVLAQRCLSVVGIFLTRIALVWLAVLAQRPPRQ
jgi:hypothetical protein